MKLINLTYPTYPEEIKQNLAINSFIEDLGDPEIRQTLRITQLKKISEALAYALQFETVKQTSRNQGRIIRKVNVEVQVEKLEVLLRRNQDVFSLSGSDLGRTNVVEHRINIESNETSSKENTVSKT